MERDNLMPLDRVKYLRRLRREMLKKLGLPPDTPPDRVQAMLESGQLGDAPDLSTDQGRVEHLRNLRNRLLKNLDLPENTPPEKLSELLKNKK
jgi:hypothetical protein